MKYTLVCDSDIKNWPSNKELYYMGYWCLQKTKYSFYNLKNFKFINCEERNDLETNNDVKKVNDLYKILIEELSIFLNKYHKKNFSKKFWEIIIGPWTKDFLGIFYERYISVKKALTIEEIDNIILANYSKHDLSNYNVLDLINKSSNDINKWNTILYTIIFEQLNQNNKKKLLKNKIIENLENPKKKSDNKLSFKKFIIFIMEKLSKRNLSKKNFFIYKLDLKFKYLFYLFFTLKQFPIISGENEYKKEKINITLRENFNFDKTNTSEFERIIRLKLKYFLPTDIIENFENLLSKVKKLEWPKNPKYIFTSYGYHGDTIFSFYLANKVEQGSKYILHQHGSNYFTGKNTIVDCGFSSCDKFISWGDPNNEKCIPLFNSKNLEIETNDLGGERIIFFAPKMSPNRKRPHDEYGKIIRDSIIFEEALDNLSHDLKKKTILKLYNSVADTDELEIKILKEIVFKRNNFKIEKSKINKELIKKSKILVHTGDGTAFLECLATKKPTICLLDNLNWIREEVRKDYEELIKANLIFLNPKDLSHHINQVYNNIDKWWLDPNVMKIKKNFCEKYSNPHPKNGLSQISRLIKEIINGKHI